MFKKEFGISVYPEKNSVSETKKYILKAKEYGYKNLFISFLQFKTSKKFGQIKNEYLKVIKFAKKHGFYIIADIADVAMQATKTSPDNLSWFSEIGVHCVRLDSPILPMAVAKATRNNNLDVQLNMSNNDHFIDNVLDFKPVLDAVSGCHNFYPQKNTGLGWDFFVESSKRYIDKGLKTSAFIGSHVGKHGPQSFDVSELVTLERHRNKPIRTQAKELAASNLISGIYIGNQAASDQELKDVSSIDLRVIELDIELSDDLSKLEQEIMFDMPHFSRGDINESFVRSTMGRVLFASREDIKVANIHDTYQRGDIVIINKNDRNYQKELVIINKDNFTGFSHEQANLVGRIKDYDLDLFSMVEPWSGFKFRVVK